MPWLETETLFSSTIKAATETTRPDSSVELDLRVVDMGEAGRQEIWRRGSHCITRVITKHGGMCPSPIVERQPSTCKPCFLLESPVTMTSLFKTHNASRVFRLC